MKTQTAMAISLQMSMMMKMKKTITTNKWSSINSTSKMSLDTDLNSTQIL